MITTKDFDLTVTGQPLQEWLNANHPDDNLIWKNGLWDQALFVRDNLHYLLCDLPYEERKKHPVQVVSTHTSKSVLLPVYEIRTAEFLALDERSWSPRHLCARLRLRYNFFNWVISVETFPSADDRFKDLFNREARVDAIYAEGFRDEWVFPPYAENRQRFTLQLHNKFELWAFAWLLRAA